MLEPAFLALTSTPSIALSSADIATPVSASAVSAAPAGCIVKHSVTAVKKTA
jgi:hypothetical protein